MTVSYLNLMKAQQKPQMLPVTLEPETFASMTKRYAGARQRLYGALPIKLVRLPKASSPEPVLLSAEPAQTEQHLIVAPEPKVAIFHDAPLNMLAPCSWKFLVSLASARHGVSYECIIGRSRLRGIAMARREAMGLVYQHTQRSLPQVGHCFDRDHTTVLSALRAAGISDKLVDMNPVPFGASRRLKRHG